MVRKLISLVVVAGLSLVSITSHAQTLATGAGARSAIVKVLSTQAGERFLATYAGQHVGKTLAEIQLMTPEQRIELLNQFAADPKNGATIQQFNQAVAAVQQSTDGNIEALTQSILTGGAGTGRLTLLREKTADAMAEDGSSVSIESVRQQFMKRFASGEFSPAQIDKVFALAQSASEAMGRPLFGRNIWQCLKTFQPQSVGNLLEIVSGLEVVAFEQAMNQAVAAKKAAGALIKKSQAVFVESAKAAEKRICQGLNSSRCGIFNIPPQSCTL